ncbi:hypothetical protein [Mesorhizobium koreense]|uniref:hypothetical protein n=1 Tax=Mesorhizobium koreense TaxID=3074855 RepID=UPI00287B83B5|nr:hypothetical protein [Mesorhizobium sp. WR6]
MASSLIAWLFIKRQQFFSLGARGQPYDEGKLSIGEIALLVDIPPRHIALAISDIDCFPKIDWDETSCLWIVIWSSIPQAMLAISISKSG